MTRMFGPVILWLLCFMGVFSNAAIIAPSTYTTTQCNTAGTSLQLLSTLPVSYLNWSSSFAPLDSYLDANALRQNSVLNLPFASSVIFPRDVFIPITDSSFAYDSSPHFEDIAASVSSLPILSQKHLYIDSSSSFTPLVQIDNGNIVVAHLFRQFRVDATLRNCDGSLLSRNETSSVSWNWVFSSSSGSGITVHSGGGGVSSSDYAWISLQPSSTDVTAYQTVYTVRVEATVTLKTGEINTSFDNATIVVRPSDLVAIIDGDDRKTSRQLPLVLDASKSFDPDQLSTYTDTFQWSCDVCGITIPNGVTNTLGALSLGLGTHVFRLDYTRGPRTIATNITVEIVNNIAPIAYIPPIVSPSTVNHHERLTNEVAISGDTSLINARFWEEATGQLDIESAILVTRTRIRTRRDMVLKERIMTPGKTYKFKFVIVTPTAESYGTVRVHVNDIPKLGTFTISPSTGTQIDTVFVARALGWTDVHDPLLYSFQYQLPTDSTDEWTMLRNFAPDPQIYFSFPVAGTNVKLRVLIRDALGGLAESKLTFNVNAQSVNIPTTNSQFLERAKEVARLNDMDLTMYGGQSSKSVVWELLYRMKSSLVYLESKYSSALGCDTTCVQEYQEFRYSISTRLASLSDSITLSDSAAHVPSDVKDHHAENWIETGVLLMGGTNSADEARHVSLSSVQHVQQVVYNSSCTMMKAFADERNSTFHDAVTIFAESMFVALSHGEASTVNTTKAMAVSILRCVRVLMHSGRIDGEAPIAVSDISANRFASGGNYAVFSFRETRDDFSTYIPTWGVSDVKSCIQSNVRVTLPGTITSSVSSGSDDSLAFTLTEYAHDPYHNSTENLDNTILTPVVDVTFFDSQRQELTFSSSQNPLEITYSGSFDIAKPKDYDKVDVSCVDFDSNIPPPWNTVSPLWSTSACTLHSQSSSELKCRCSHTSFFSVLRLRTPTVFVSLLLPVIVTLSVINGFILISNSALFCFISIASCVVCLCFCLIPCIRGIIRFILMCIRQRRIRNYWRRQVKFIKQFERRQLAVERKIKKQAHVLEQINAKLKLRLVQELMSQSVSLLPETEFFVKSLYETSMDGITTPISEPEADNDDVASVMSHQSHISHLSHASAAQLASQKHKVSILECIDINLLDTHTLHMLMFLTNHASLEMVLKVQICVIQEVENLLHKKFSTGEKQKKKGEVAENSWLAQESSHANNSRDFEKYFESIPADVLMESVVIICNRVTLLLSMGLQKAAADLVSAEALLVKRRAAWARLKEDEEVEKIIKRQVNTLQTSLDAALSEKDYLVSKKEALIESYTELARKFADQKYLSIEFKANIDQVVDRCTQRRVLIQSLIKLYESLKQSDAQLQNNLLNLQNELESVVKRAQMNMNRSDTDDDGIMCDDDDIHVKQLESTVGAWRCWMTQVPDPVYNSRKFSCSICNSYLHECVICDSTNPRYSEYACKACLLKRYNVKYLSQLKKKSGTLGAVHLNMPKEDLFHQHLVNSYLETQWAHQLSNLNPDQFPFHSLTFSNPKQILGMFDTQQVDQLATILLSKAKFYIVLSKEAQKGGNLTSALSRMEYARFHLIFLLKNHKEHLMQKQYANVFEEVSLVLASIHGSLGDIHVFESQYPEAVSCFQDAIECVRQGEELLVSVNDESRTSPPYRVNTLCLCFQKLIRLLIFLQRSEEAAEQMDACMELLERDTSGSAEVLHGKLLCQMRKADLLKVKGDFVGALKVYQATLQRILMLREGDAARGSKEKRRRMWKDLKDVIVARKLETLNELQKA
mmetsp:Transcript_8619/g.31858  ORF Transcript_8619/g.31858 Transcript_8619/m.31858 type:complete len:1778 (-) Transcript_8619:4845-10178(-)